MSKILPDIDAVEPLAAEDELCLQEVREVLDKHNRLNRFGITLLHSHFPVSDDETLVEECDEANRTLTIKPVKTTSLAQVKLVETNWILTNYTPVLKCTQVCAKSDNGGHNKVHSPFAT